MRALRTFTAATAVGVLALVGTAHQASAQIKIGAVLSVSAVFLASMYKWPAFEVRGFEVLTHKPSIAAYRAPVAPQTIFAIDSHMEQIARALGVDSGRSGKEDAGNLC